MAAVSQNQSSKQPPFPLKPIFEETSYPTKRLQHRMIQHNGAVDTRKVELSFCPDPSDKERLVTVLDDYMEACDDDNLNYHGVDRHKHAADVLGKDLRRVWAKKLAALPNGQQADANFVDNVRNFLMTFLNRSAFNIQREYMTRATKPFHMDCYTLASRLRTINDLSVYLPGSGGTFLYQNDTAMKNAYYHLMLPQWQTNFDAAGHSTDDDNYTMDKMAAFMEQQRMMSQPRNPSTRGRGNGRANNRYHPYGRGQGKRGYHRYHHTGWAGNQLVDPPQLPQAPPAPPAAHYGGRGRGRGGGESPKSGMSFSEGYRL